MYPRRGSAASPVNRQQRRREQAELRKRRELFGVAVQRLNGLMRVDVILSHRIIEASIDKDNDIDIIEVISDWQLKVVEGLKPLCLLCDFEWTSTRLPPPAAYGLVRSHKFFERQHTANIGLVSGICLTCCEKHREKLLERAIEVYRKVWPDLRSGVGVQDAPDGVQ